MHYELSTPSLTHALLEVFPNDSLFEGRRGGWETRKGCGERENRAFNSLFSSFWSSTFLSRTMNLPDSPLFSLISLKSLLAILSSLYRPALPSLYHSLLLSDLSIFLLPTLFFDISSISSQKILPDTLTTLDGMGFNFMSNEVSAGFDAAKGDHIGQCLVTPEGFAHMTYMLKSLADGKIILALEGGYNLDSIASSMTACSSILLGAQPPRLKSVKASPKCAEVVQRVSEVHSKYWDCLKPTYKHPVYEEGKVLVKLSGNSKKLSLLPLEIK